MSESRRRSETCNESQQTPPKKRKSEGGHVHRQNVLRLLIRIRLFVMLKIIVVINVPIPSHLVDVIFTPSVSTLLSIPPLRVAIPTLRLVALQPLAQRISEVFPADRTAREVRPEIVTMLCIRHCVAE
jgi:hypothetical protein